MVKNQQNLENCEKSLPIRPHSLFLLDPFPNENRNLSLLSAQTVSAKKGPLPGQVNPASL